MALAAVGGLGVALPATAAVAVPVVSGVAPEAAAPATAASGRVIVMLRNQSAPVSLKTAAVAHTSIASARAAQSDVAGTVRAVGGRVTQRFSLINAMSATVTPAQAQRLAADPAVAAVVPDARIKTPQATAAADPDLDSSAGVAPQANVCPTDPNAVQLEPEALEATRANSDVPGAVTARSLGFDGTGVKVAYMAEGIDINNPDLMRNGKSIFTDYKDFSGDGIEAATAAGEAFLDASAIAAQGNQTYDVSHFSKLPLSQACKIRVEGEAPGVDLIGLKVFGDTYTTTSGFLDAIQYAVDNDHVDILSQSFGGTEFPDTSQDVIRAADEAAVAKGTTITVSTGDAGITNTIGTPASDPDVIAVGATTTYRFDLQTGYAAARVPEVDSWLDDNISSLSSGGTTNTARTVDLVAPGELNWGLCTADLTKYEDCTDYANQASDLEASGGTSESAPVVAGVAALVIQAYEKGHNGVKPSPAVVKTILMGSADDVSAPADQQGAGLVDAAKAVELAQAYDGGTPSAAAVVTTSLPTVKTVGYADHSTTFGETLTNQSSAPQTLKLDTRALGGYSSLTEQSVDLEDPAADGTGSPQYVDFQGYSDNYAKVTFTVPAGLDRLATSIAYQASDAALSHRVRLTLIDPSGKLAGYSLPQGIGNFGHSEVAHPAPGTWTAYVTARRGADGGTTGPVVFGASGASYHRFGTVSPSTMTLAPGASAKATVTVPRDSGPGDVPASLVIGSTPSAGSDPVLGSPDALADTATTTVPIIVRTVIPADHSTTFTQTVTGPNGRDGYPGYPFYYEIPVAKGTAALNVAMNELTDNDPNQAQGVLVSPEGNATAFGSNITTTTSPLGGSDSEIGKSLVMRTMNPQPGNWQLILDFAPTVNGEELSSPFTVGVSENKLPVSQQGLPSSFKTNYVVGGKHVAQIKVTNNTTSAEAYFLDPRLNRSVRYGLTSVSDADATAPPTGSTPFYVVPSDTTMIQTSMDLTDGSATQIEYDTFGPIGDPDLESDQGTSAHLDYSADPVVAGLWGMTPAQVGPSPDAGEKPAPVTTRFYATTKGFDTNVESSTGDMWRVATNPDLEFDPVTVQPGKTAIIQVTFAPQGAGRKSGTIFLDDAQLFQSQYGSTFNSPNANQIAALPYHYTAVSKADAKAQQRAAERRQQARQQKARQQKARQQKVAHRR